MNDDELDAIRERKKQELARERTGDAEQETPSEPIEVEDGDHLDRIIDQYDRVLVDFYAVWCGPCQMMEPAVEQLAADDDVAVAKVNVDTRREVAQSWGVQSMPTLVAAKNGEPAERAVGARDYDALRQLVA